MTDAEYMRRAISLAEKGRGWTNPNPLVGCVIVKNGEIVAQGYHEKIGGWHAERNAILNSQADLTDATAYVTLEPCCHHGRTPPCSDLLIERGIKKVFIGSRDPNPLVSGKGAKQLRAAGVEVIEDFLREECDQLNPIKVKCKNRIYCNKINIAIFPCISNFKPHNWKIIILEYRNKRANLWHQERKKQLNYRFFLCGMWWYFLIW